ncbi:hypothetical protein BHM03_00048226 [Ensete ventricosum]|nr:hypothetical protein BHM03_00048226 [Ensete ventricosum]
MMRWDLVGSLLGDSSKESGSSLGTRKEITGKKTGGLTVRLSEVAGVCGNDGPRYSLGIEPSSDDAVGSHRKFAKRFAERIGKLTGKKIGGLAARLPEYAGVGS